MTTTRHLARPHGRIAYDDRGHGPLVVAVPGMGDTRAEYRELAPRLMEAGYRVATMDLRGHGESDATFRDVSRPAAGDDVVALLRDLDAGPAHLIGCSFGASAVVWAAAEAPADVASLTLVGPFVRELGQSPLKTTIQRTLIDLLLRRPWGPAAWSAYYAKLYPSHQPDDLAAHRAAIRTNLAEPGRLETLRAMMREGSERIEPRLAELHAPTLVVMGTADPDFPDPTAEAHQIASQVGPAPARVELIEGAGHYPHVERPDVTTERLLQFLRQVQRAPNGA